MQITLSFIIPCYNAGNYIDSCLDSILSCSVPKEEYEILCIDDCSTDNTYEILLHYSKQYSNLRIIRHASNLGLGATRNNGINSAEGDYLWFVDADDTILPDAVETLLNKAMCNKLDVLCFNYSNLDNRGGRINTPQVFKDTNIKAGLVFVYDTFGKDLIYHIGYPWRFLLKRDYIIKKRLEFPQGVYFEDTVWMPKVLMLADKVQGCDVIGYNYWHHSSSIMGTFNSHLIATHIYDWCIATGQQLNDFSKELRIQGNEFYEYSVIFERFALERYLNYLPVLLGRSTINEVINFYRMAELNSVLKSSNLQVFFSKGNLLTKILLSKPWGKFVAIPFSWYYKSTHKKWR